MSSPHVTGTVALLLQKNPCATLEELKTAITGSAATDSFTEAVAATPNNIFGTGKLDALAAIQALSDVDSSCSITTDDDGGTSSASSGCGNSIVASEISPRWEMALLMLIPLLFLASVRLTRPTS